MARDAGPRRLLVGACGSVFVTMLPSYLVALKTGLDCRVTVVMTASAAQFVPARTIGLFADDVLDGTDASVSFSTNHVKLASEQDLILVLPATAHMLAVAATGQAPSLLALTVLAASCPVVFVPSMNRVMWQRAAVQRNVARLREDGYHVVEPDWQPRFELATRQMAENPNPPTPKRIVALVEELTWPRNAGS